MSKILKIVITGGPCAGKSSALEYLIKYYQQQNIKVFYINEVATELINQGIAPWTCKTSLEFQKIRMNLQFQKELEIDEKIKKCNDDKILVIYDRGLMDSNAYTKDNEFSNVLKDLNLSIIEARDRYDAVFHLSSVSKDKQEFYTLSNNSARIETIEEAKVLDDKIISTWIGHPHFRIIKSYDLFIDKVNQLINEVNNLLDNNSLEIERKYLIKYPNITFLENYQFCNKVEISQSYLNINGENIRVRKRGINNNYIYIKTIKKSISAIKRIELEERITEVEYNALINQSTSTSTLNKDRYCLLYKNQYFEIDVFPFWKEFGLMEIELNEENQKIDFPDFIEIIKEVTEDKYYTNHNLSKVYKS